MRATGRNNSGLSGLLVEAGIGAGVEILEEQIERHAPALRRVVQNIEHAGLEIRDQYQQYERDRAQLERAIEEQMRQPVIFSGRRGTVTITPQEPLERYNVSATNRRGDRAALSLNQERLTLRGEVPRERRHRRHRTTETYAAEASIPADPTEAITASMERSHIRHRRNSMSQRDTNFSASLQPQNMELNVRDHRNSHRRSRIRQNTRSLSVGARPGNTFTIEAEDRNQRHGRGRAYEDRLHVRGHSSGNNVEYIEGDTMVRRSYEGDPTHRYQTDVSIRPPRRSIDVRDLRDDPRLYRHATVTATPRGGIATMEFSSSPSGEPSRLARRQRRESAAKKPKKKNWFKRLFS